MRAGIKIENIFWLFALKKDKYALLLVVEVDNAKMTNMLIEKRLVLDHILHRCMRYNLAYRTTQYLNYYKYGYILVYCKINIWYRACLGLQKLWNAFKTRCKNAHDAIVLTPHRTNEVIIEKKNISE